MTGGELATDLEAELASLRKQVADANAERIRLESALVDAMGALQFYANREAWKYSGASDSPPTEAEIDAGKRARVTLNRLFERAAHVERVQSLRPPVQEPPADGLGGCDTCEEP